MRGRRLPDARRHHSAYELVGGAPRPALPPQPGAVRPEPLDRRVRGGVAALRVFSVQRGTQTVHRSRLRDDVGLPHPGYGSTTVNYSSRSASQKIRNHSVELIRALARRPMAAALQNAQLRVRKAFVRSLRPFYWHYPVALAMD